LPTPTEAATNYRTDTMTSRLLQRNAHRSRLAGPTQQDALAPDPNAAETHPTVTSRTATIPHVAAELGRIETIATMTPLTTPAPDTHITITTYNVVSARGTKLLEALRAMHDLNTDIAILTETKLTGNRHARMGHGYNIVATDASSPSKGVSPLPGALDRNTGHLRACGLSPRTQLVQR